MSGNISPSSDPKMIQRKQTEEEIDKEHMSCINHSIDHAVVSIG